MAMKVEIKNNKLCIEIDLEEPYRHDTHGTDLLLHDTLWLQERRVFQHRL